MGHNERENVELAFFLIKKGIPILRPFEFTILREILGKKPKGMPESHQIMVALPSVLQIGRVFLLGRHSPFLANFVEWTISPGQFAITMKSNYWQNIFGS
jgi:hypothetical protein